LQGVPRHVRQRQIAALRPQYSVGSLDAKPLGGNQHGSHGRRIDRDEARQQPLHVIDLEDDQRLQEEVLTLYHLSTIAFEMGPAMKSVIGSNGRLWVKHTQM